MSFISKLRSRPHGVSPRDDYLPSDLNAPYSPTSSSYNSSTSYFPQIPQAAALAPLPVSHNATPSFTASSSSPPVSSSHFLTPQSMPSRPRLPHMSHSSSAITTKKSSTISPALNHSHDVNSPPNNPHLQQQYQLLLQQHRLQKSQQNTEGQIFGVPLEVSINYAKSNMIYEDKDGNEHVYGQIPIIVAKCAYYLKNNAADVEGIFRVSGSSRRIKELQSIFSSPPTYGKDLDWVGFTVHDAANVFRRYLNNLPEPIIPLEFYDKFRQPLLVSPLIVEHLKGNEAISATNQHVISTTSKQKNSETLESAESDITDPQNFNGSAIVPPMALEDEIKEAIAQYKELIETLPSLNRQLLLYILDLLAFFASKSQKNLMPTVNLAAIFQPSILSHPTHNMEPNAYHLSRAVSQFLIEHFRSIQPKLKWGAKTASTNDTSTHKIRHHVRRHSKSMSSVTVPSSIASILSNEPEKKKADKPDSLSPTSSPLPPKPPKSPPPASTGFISSIKRASSIGRRRRTSSTSTDHSASSSSKDVSKPTSPTLSAHKSNNNHQEIRKSSIPEAVQLASPKLHSSQPPKVPVLLTTPASSASVTTPSSASLDNSANPTSASTNNNANSGSAGVSSVVSSPRFVSSSSISGSSSEGECDNDLYNSENHSSGNFNVDSISGTNVTSTSKTGNDDSKKRQSRFRGHRRKISESLSQMSNLLTRRSLSPLHRGEDDKRLGVSSLENKLETNNASSRSVASVASNISVASNGASPSADNTILAPVPHHSGATQHGSKIHQDLAENGAYGRSLSSAESSVNEDSEEDENSVIKHKIGENSSTSSSLAKQQRVSKWRRSLMAINIPVGNGSSPMSESTTPALDEAVLSPTSALAFSNGYFPSVKDYSPSHLDTLSPPMENSPSGRQSWIRAPFKSKSRNNSATAVDNVKEDEREASRSSHLGIKSQESLANSASSVSSKPTKSSNATSNNNNNNNQPKEGKNPHVPIISKSMIIDDVPVSVKGDDKTDKTNNSNNDNTQAKPVDDKKDINTAKQDSLNVGPTAGMADAHDTLDNDKNSLSNEQQFDKELTTISEKPEEPIKPDQHLDEPKPEKIDDIALNDDHDEKSDDAVDDFETPKEEKDLHQVETTLETPTIKKKKEIQEQGPESTTVGEPKTQGVGEVVSEALDQDAIAAAPVSDSGPQPKVLGTKTVGDGSTPLDLSLTNSKSVDVFGNKANNCVMDKTCPEPEACQQTKPCESSTSGPQHKPDSDQQLSISSGIGCNNNNNGDLRAADIPSKGSLPVANISNGVNKDVTCEAVDGKALGETKPVQTETQDVPSYSNSSNSLNSSLDVSTCSSNVTSNETQWISFYC